MTSDKKITVLRIIIFTVISYGIVIASTAVFGYMEDTLSWKIFGFFGIAFAPAIANYLTRLITKEGFKDKLYAANFGGNIKYYVLAAVLPVVVYIIAANITGMVFVPDYSVSEVINADNIAGFIYETLRIVSTSVLIFPLYFGEEYGWRAYLTPKLKTLMPKPAALIVSGIIWGMWHAPVVYMGHNFGTNYSLYPYGGYMVMSVYCIFVGCLLTWLTEKTGSIYPACICHAVNNNIGTFLLSVFLSAGMTDEIYSAKQFEIVTLHLLPMAVVCIPFMILLLRKNNQTERA
ncbi:CPBP family intramembrane glutamic endopeptidase [Huintestinicola sp.]|uniref:CPBP family intramembrane glutamic endopeptidase n=1 Tax=Huintestinicola sp. TaxID=2981661 RepID=UPI003D7C9867